MPTPQERYAAAAHAMQSGVAMEMELPGSHPATEPKHLRVGINSALADSSALAELLINKGILNEAEYLEALATAMESEAKRYETILSDRLGTNVTLG
jgi:hypothetical protein